MSHLILQPSCRFTYITAHCLTLPLLHLRHSSFPDPSFAAPTSQSLHWRVTNMCRADSPTFPSLHLRHNSFPNPSVALPTSQLILQPFRRFTYVTAHCLTLPLLHLRHSSFSNPSVASPTLQFIPQPFFRFSYVTSPSLRPNSPGESPMPHYEMFVMAHYKKPIFQGLISRVLLIIIETRDQVFCIALASVAICIPIGKTGLLYLFYNIG